MDVRDFKVGGRKMPPPQEAIADAVETLMQLNVESFRIEPTMIRPFQQAKIIWRITSETGGSVPLKLQGGGLNMSISRQGQRVVSPTVTTTYRLVATLLGQVRQLGAIILTVDSSACITLALSEADVRSNLTTAVNNYMADKPELRRRSDDRIEVEADGIHAAIRLTAVVEDWADPDINIDFQISLNVADGQPVYAFAKYEFHIDFPWWADILAGLAFPAWLGLAIKEGSEREKARQFIGNEIQHQLDDLKQQIPSGFRLLTIRTEPNQVACTICPT